MSSPSIPAALTVNELLREMPDAAASAGLPLARLLAALHEPSGAA